MFGLFAELPPKHSADILNIKEIIGKIHRLT